MRGIAHSSDSVRSARAREWLSEVKGFGINLYANNGVIMKYNAKTGGEVG